MKATIRRTGRCVCGVKVALHYDVATNRKLTCEQARRAHPRAAQKACTFAQMCLRLVPKEER